MESSFRRSPLRAADDASSSEPKAKRRGELPRRTFLVGAAAGAGLLSSTRPAQAQGDEVRLDQHPNFGVVGAVVLPSDALGTPGLRQALERCGRWIAAFEPVAELDHDYLASDDIRYGPPDPRPLWRAQLDALDLEAQQRFSTTFARLEPGRQEGMVRAAIDRAWPRPAGASMPRPEAAPHVALAIMAWYFRSTEANDLCYAARIGRHECRGMRGVTDIPRPLRSERS